MKITGRTPFSPARSPSTSLWSRRPFDFDRAALEDAFRQGAKAIIVCNPSNPTGKVFTREELEYIGALAQRYDAYVITDEVYEHIVFAPFHHVHMAGLPGMEDRTITCSSLSKTYSITGWRLGYLIGPAEVIEHAKRSTISSPSGPPPPFRRLPAWESASLNPITRS